MTPYTMPRKEWAHAANCLDHFYGATHLAYALDRVCWEFDWDQPVTIPLDHDAELYVLSALTEDVIESDIESDEES